MIESLFYLNLHGVGRMTRAIDSGEYSRWLDVDVLNAVLDLASEIPNVRLTVDDGNASDHAIVLPALLKRRLHAIFFVCSDRIDRPTFLSRTQIRELHSQGMVIGSHGAAHVPWRHLGDQELRHELVDSRHSLEDVCGAPIRDAACPFGSYGRRTLSALRRAGYRSVYTSDGGSTSDAQWLRARNTVTRTASLDDIRHVIQCRTPALRQTLRDIRKLVKRLRA